jgi:hypothetical protein
MTRCGRGRGDSSGLPEATERALGGFGKRLREEMAIDVGGATEQRVPYHFLDELERYAYRDAQADGRMA